MEIVGDLTSEIDWALVILYAFWLFFFGLVFRLVRENRREGYPVIDEVTLKQEKRGPIAVPDPKEYLTQEGEHVWVPRLDEKEPPVTNAVPLAPFPGAPLVPIGNPLTSGVGPAAWVERWDRPDITAEHEQKLVPMRRLPEHEVEEHDADPRGMEVVGADGQPAGVVTDLWIDRSEMMVRYLEVRLDPSLRRAAQVETVVEATAVAVDMDSGDAAVATVIAPVPTAAGADTILLPMNSATVAPMYGQVTTPTILAHQFADVPRIKNPDAVTLREEDRIMAYFSAGELYATPSRSEPFL